MMKVARAVTCLLRGVSSGALLAAAAVGIVNPPALAGLGVQPAFQLLVQSLEAAQGSKGNRAGVEAAGLKLENAIRVDGGARKALMSATRNIVMSLKDGSFDADASLRALHAVAAQSVVDFGPWQPGPAYPKAIGLSLHQKGEGDCVGISALKAFSTTKVGEALLQGSVARDAADGFTVRLPGAPSRTFHLSGDTLDQYGIGDPAGAAIIGALFQYFGLDPHHAALPTNKIMELLAGNLGRHARLADAQASPHNIARFLIESAPAVGSNVAMVFGGKPAHGGDWSRGDGHAFAVLRIDAKSGTVFYTNSWNEDRVHTITIADLAAQAAGSSADFETVSF